MSPARKKPAAPDVTDIDDVLLQRFDSMPTPKAEEPKAPASRPAPEGMKRISLYVTAEAAEALDQAASEVLAGVPFAKKHEALSALLMVAAGHREQVTADLKAQILARLPH